jgi:pimeloyl-ACP methyl ester carboxylesterase
MTTAPVDEIVRLGDHRVRVRIRGTGAPLLLLNGVGAPLEIWQPLVRRLGGMRTVAFDAPGSGRSGTPDLPLSVSGHAAVAAHLLDELGYDAVAVLGFSFGGMVAQELARRAPTRVERLVLASTSCGWGGVPGSPAALFAVSSPERAYARALSDVVESDGDDDTDGLLRLWRHGLPPAAAARRGHLYQMWAAASWSSLLWLRELTRPALVVTGDADPLVPPVNARILAGRLPDARLHIVDGGGHLCLIDRAEQVAPIVRAFLA